MKEVDDARASPFSAPLQAPAQLADAPGSGNEIAFGRIACQILDQLMARRLGHQFVRPRYKFRRLDDCDQQRSRHAFHSSPMDYLMATHSWLELSALDLPLAAVSTSAIISAVPLHPLFVP